VKKRRKDVTRCQHVEDMKKCKRVGVTVAKNGKLYCNSHLVQFNKSKVDMFEVDEPQYEKYKTTYFNNL
jgi:hypothetical protein